MGEYFEVVNLDKRERFDADAFCQNIKRGGLCAGFQRDALMLLLSTTRLGSAIDPLVGRWIGDRIAVVGDNSALSDDLEEGEEFTDINSQVRELIQRSDPIGWGEWIKQHGCLPCCQTCPLTNEQSEQ